MRQILSPRAVDYAVLSFFAFGILWRGGKGIEATWLLAMLAGGITFVWWTMHWKDDARSMGDTAWVASLLFLLWSVLSYVFSLARNYGLDEVLRDAALFLLLLWAVRRASHDARWPERILRFLAVTALVAGLVGVFVYVLQPVNRMVGTYFDYRFHTDYWPNAWAEFLLLAWPAFYFFYRSEVSQRRRWIGTIGLGFLLGCLFLSYSRGALIAFFGQVVLLIVFQMRRDDRESASAITRARSWFRRARGPLPHQAVLLPVIALVVFVLCNAARAQFFDVQSIREKITFTAAEGDSSKTERLQFWEQSLRLVSQRPLTGFGPYSFRFAQPYLQQGVLQTSDHAHNVLLKIASERGLVALLFWLIAVSALVVPAVVKAWKGALTIAQLSSLIALAGLFAHNLIDYNLQFVGIAVAATLLLANIVEAKPSRLAPHARRTAEVLAAVLLLIVTVWEGRYLVLSSLGRRAEARGDVAHALVWYERSELELFSRDLFLSQAQLAMRSGDHETTERALGHYQQVNPLDYRLAKIFAQWHLQKGDREAAVPWLSQAFRGGKFNDLSIPILYLTVAEQAKAEGMHMEILDADLSTDALEDLFAAYRTALLTNAHYIDLSPNADAFQEFAQILAKRNPDSASFYTDVAAEVRSHVQMERERLASRRPGYLW